MSLTHVETLPPVVPAYPSLVISSLFSTPSATLHTVMRCIGLLRTSRADRRGRSLRNLVKSVITCSSASGYVLTLHGLSCSRAQPRCTTDTRLCVRGVGYIIGGQIYFLASKLEVCISHGNSDMLDSDFTTRRSHLQVCASARHNEDARGCCN